MAVTQEDPYAEPQVVECHVFDYELREQIKELKMLNLLSNSPVLEKVIHRHEYMLEQWEIKTIKDQESLHARMQEREQWERNKLQQQQMYTRTGTGLDLGIYKGHTTTTDGVPYETNLIPTSDTATNIMKNSTYFKTFTGLFKP